MIPSKASPEVGAGASPYGPPGSQAGTAAAAATAAAALVTRGGRADDHLREGRNAAVGSGNVSTAAAAAKAERYIPKVFGFKINEIAKLQRWQGAMRDRQIARLEATERGES